MRIERKRETAVTRIASFFLRAKHWQLFLLLVLGQIVAEFAAFITLPPRIHSWREFGPIGLLLLATMVLIFLCFLAWLGALGMFFRSMEKPELRMETGFFRFALIYPAIYMPIFFATLFTDRLDYTALIIPLHLLAMVCLFYNLFFVSKNLVIVEKERSVTFSEYAGPFFLLWFYPIGIWIIQPKVNQLYSRQGSVGSFH